MMVQYPSILMALPVILLFFIALFVLFMKRRSRLLKRFAGNLLVNTLLKSISTRKRIFKECIMLLGLTCAWVALSRPQWGYEWREVQAKGIDVLIGIDVSKSMLAEDTRPNRLERSKLAILDFLNRLQGDRVGLIAFAGDAFLQCPLTLDYDAFQLCLEAANPRIIERGGTDIAAVIEVAEQSFAEDENFKLLILITDGEDLSEEGIFQAKRAAEHGVKIYTVGVGTKEGELIPVQNSREGNDYMRDPSGNLVKTKLDEETLREIARETGGFYVPLGVAGEGLDAVYERGLQEIPQKELESSIEKIAIERYQWPLSLAILLLGLETLLKVRRSIRQKESKKTSNPDSISVKKRFSKKFHASIQGFILTLVLASFIQDLKGSQREALEYYDGGHYREAIYVLETDLRAQGVDPESESQLDRQEESESKKKAQKIFQGDAAFKYFQNLEEQKNRKLHYHLGISYYKGGEWDKAERELEKLEAVEDLELQERAWYNLGNVQYRKGSEMIELDKQKTIDFWEKALISYKTAIELNPQNDAAKHNYVFVKKKLDVLKEQQEQEEQSQENNPDNNSQDSDSNEKDDDSSKNKGSEDQENNQNDSKDHEGEASKDDLSKEDHQDDLNPKAQPKGQDAEDKKEDSDMQKDDNDKGDNADKNLGDHENLDNNESKQNGSHDVSSFNGIQSNNGQVMNISPDEAARILEMMKREEKQLFWSVGDDKNHSSDRVYKDW